MPSVNPGMDNRVGFVWTALFLAIALAMGLLLGRLTTANFLFAILLALGLLVMVLATDLKLGWMLLFVASTLSGFNYRGGLNFRPDQVLFVWLAILWLIYFLRGQTRLHRVPLLIPVAGYLIANLFSSFIAATDKGASFQGCLLLAIYLSMYAFTVNILTENKEIIRKIPSLLAGIGIVQAVYAVVSLLFLEAGIQLYGAARSSVQGFGIILKGGFEEPNLLGAFIMVVAIFLFAHLVSRSNWKSGSKLAAGLMLLLVVLFLTFTRAAWLGFALAAFLMIFMFRPQRNFFNPRTLGYIVGFAAVLFIIALPFGNYISGVTGGSRQLATDRISQIFDFSSGTGGARTQVESTALTRWEANPVFGNGTFGFPVEAAGFATHLNWLYSSVVQSLHDTGIVGFGFLMWIYIGGIVTGVRGYLRCKTLFWKASLAGGTLAWLGMIVASQASSFIWLSFPWIFLGILVCWSSFAPEMEANQMNEFS